MRRSAFLGLGAGLLAMAVMEPDASWLRQETKRLSIGKPNNGKRAKVKAARAQRRKQRK